MSLSCARRTALSHSPTGTGVCSASPVVSPSPARPPNKSYWPAASALLISTAESMTSSWTAARPLRVWPRESNAPALMSDSTTRRLHTCTSTFATKSWKSVNRPRERRVSLMDRTTPSPTLRIADNPNRMSLPRAVYAESESLTSGGNTLMPIRRHSPR